LFDLKNPRISLRVYIEGQIPSRALQNAILVTHKFINSCIAKGKPFEDPFVFKRRVGAHFEAQSSKYHQLTWTTLLITLEGLYHVLYEEQRFNQVQFEISDTTVQAVIGTGRLAKEE